MNQTKLCPTCTLYETNGLPASVDWRLRGGVTSVKDQGDCNTCYSYAATGAIEGSMFVKTGKKWL